MGNAQAGACTSAFPANWASTDRLPSIVQSVLFATSGKQQRPLATKGVAGDGVNESEEPNPSIDTAPVSCGVAPTFTSRRSGSVSAIAAASDPAPGASAASG